MKAKSKRKVEACKRSLRHITDHPLTPANARLTALTTQMTAEVASFRDYCAGQSGGEAEFHSGTMTRRQMAEVLRADMRAINQMAKSLPKEQFPGVRELFLMPRGGSYEALIARANAFVDKVGPIKSVFVDRGLPADFDEQLATKLAAVDTATDTRESGRSERVGGTAGLAEQFRSFSRARETARSHGDRKRRGWGALVPGLRRRRPAQVLAGF